MKKMNDKIKNYLDYPSNIRKLEEARLAALSLVQIYFEKKLKLLIPDMTEKEYAKAGNNLAYELFSTINEFFLLMIDENEKLRKAANKQILEMYELIEDKKDE